MFAFESAPLRSSRGTGGAPLGDRHHGISQNLRKTLSRREAILALRPMFSGADGQHRTHQAPAETIDDSVALGGSQRGCGGDVEAQLHARIGRVHTLTAGPGSTGEELDELTGRDDKASGRTGPRQHTQIVHAPSLS